MTIEFLVVGSFAFLVAVVTIAGLSSESKSPVEHLVIAMSTIAMYVLIPFALLTTTAYTLAILCSMTAGIVVGMAVYKFRE